MDEYCNAIRTVKLPEKPSTTGSRERNRFYNDREFQAFVTDEIDIRDMGKHMADFSQSGDVGQKLHVIRGALQAGIQQRFPYNGALAQIGSFYDGSKTGRLNEMDCLYVIDESNVIVKQVTDTQGQFEIWLDERKIKPREINLLLMTALADSLCELALPEGWGHGGYASPEFGGVRCNGPAVTAMFRTRGEDHMSLDVSVTVPLTSQLQKKSGFPESLKEQCQGLEKRVSHIQRELKRTQISADLHLIGNLPDNTWQPTTALAEAEILRVLNPEFSLKRALEICKATVSMQQKWYEEHATHCDRTVEIDSAVDVPPKKRMRSSGDHHREVVLRELKKYVDTDSVRKSELRHKLNLDLQYQHIWLSPADRKDFKEVLKGEASINTAAIKHILLRAACQMKGAFSKASSTNTDRLIRAVFEDLASSESVLTPHALIDGAVLPKFSISVSLSHVKEDVAQDLQEQCRCILDDALVKVRGTEQKKI